MVSFLFDSLEHFGLGIDQKLSIRPEMFDVMQTLRCELDSGVHVLFQSYSKSQKQSHNRLSQVSHRNMGQQQTSTRNLTTATSLYFYNLASHVSQERMPGRPGMSLNRLCIVIDKTRVECLKLRVLVRLFRIQRFHMLTLSCLNNSNCPFQYECVDMVCQHLPVFPFQVFPTIVYFFLPFLLIITNVGGLSGGIFKVIIFMDLLNYTAGEATPLMAGVNAGAALANFLLLIFRRHPYRNTSLVDFNVVFIVIPGLLAGTTAGVVLNKLLNDLTQDIMLLVVCGYFAWVFIGKYMHQMRVERKESEETIYDIVLDDLGETDKAPERIEFDKHEAGYHLREISLSIILFAILLVVTALSQGTLTGFEICSITYVISTSCYAVAMVVVLLAVYKFTALKQKFMKSIKYIYSTDLTNKKTFGIILGGSVVAGLLQGVLGMGSGHMLSYTLLALGFLPQVISGTSGFLVAFTTSATLIQEVSMKNISASQGMMFLGITFAITIVGTHFAIKYLKNLQDFGNTILLILGLLCVFSILGIIVNVVMTIYYFGFDSLLQWRSIC